MTEQKKINMNIATVGHIDHGKTTLSAAASKFCAEKWGGKFKAYKDIDNSKEERERGITIAVSTLLVQTEKRQYAWSDCPGHESFMKNTLSGTSSIDAALLILSAKDSLQEQTIAHLKSIRERGTQKIVVVLTKMDLAEADVRELAEMELQGIMAELGYHEVQIPQEVYDSRNDFTKDNSSLFSHENRYEYVVVRVSAHLALNDDQSEYGMPSIALLMKVLDDFLPNPIRDYDSPFAMYVEQPYAIKGRGIVVSGKVYRGTCKPGQELKLVGLGCHYTGTVTSMEAFNKPLDEARAGQNVGILLRFQDAVTIEQIKRGALLTVANTYEEMGEIKCIGYFSDTKASKTRKSREKQTYKSGYEPQLSIHTALITGKVTFQDKDWKDLDEGTIITEGDEAVHMKIALHTPIAFPKNLTSNPAFIMREGSENKAYGYIEMGAGTSETQ